MSNSPIIKFIHLSFFLYDSEVSLKYYPQLIDELERDENRPYSIHVMLHMHSPAHLLGLLLQYGDGGVAEDTPIPIHQCATTPLNLAVDRLPSKLRDGLDDGVDSGDLPWSTVPQQSTVCVDGEEGGVEMSQSATTDTWIRMRWG